MHRRNHDDGCDNQDFEGNGIDGGSPSRELDQSLGSPGEFIQSRKYFVENCSRNVPDAITKITFIYSGELEDQGDGWTTQPVVGVSLDQYGAGKAQGVKLRSKRNDQDGGKARGSFLILNDDSWAAACLSVASFRCEVDPVQIT
jgi:hypothetical protein